MAYKVIILYQLYMPSYFLGTFTEYPYLVIATIIIILLATSWTEKGRWILSSVLIISLTSTFLTNKTIKIIIAILLLITLIITLYFNLI